MSLVANEDFQHILRIQNTNVDGKQKVMFALTSIKGIGRRFANIICKKADVDMNKRAGELSAAEIDQLMTIVGNPRQFKIPDWFLNRQKDYKDGKYSQVVSNALDMKLRDDLERLKKIRSSKDFSDMHGLVMHTYNSDNADLIVDHLGLHKALCILMGWNYRTLPDNSKAYQLIPAEEAAANMDDLILWPPLVIIHNTLTGKGRDGRMEGMGNRAMDNYIRELGIGGGKSKSLYSRDGHLGITLIKFAADQSGLEEALRLSEHFEKDNRGRKGWARVESLVLGKDDESNPNIVKVDQKTGEKRRVYYGYLANISDIDKVDFDTKKKIMIESHREYRSLK